LYLSIFFSFLSLHPTPTIFYHLPTSFFFSLYALFFFFCRSNPQLCIKYCIFTLKHFLRLQLLGTHRRFFRVLFFRGTRHTLSPASATSLVLDSRCAYIGAVFRFGCFVRPPEPGPPPFNPLAPLRRSFFYIVNVPCPFFLIVLLFSYTSHSLRVDLALRPHGRRR
jgi:hypothetical protein